MGRRQVNQQPPEDSRVLTNLLDRVGRISSTSEWKFHNFALKLAARQCMGLRFEWWTNSWSNGQNLISRTILAVLCPAVITTLYFWLNYFQIFMCPLQSYIQIILKSSHKIPPLPNHYDGPLKHCARSDRTQGPLGWTQCSPEWPPLADSINKTFPLISPYV